MRIAALLLSLCLLGACQKTMTVGCHLNPKIVLYPTGYTTAEWDTIYIKLYEPNIFEPKYIDTFVAKDLQDALVITVDQDYKYNLEILVPAANRTHRVNAVQVEDATITQQSNEHRKDCYRTIRFRVDTHSYHAVNNGIVRAELKK